MPFNSWVFLFVWCTFWLICLTHIVCQPPALLALCWPTTSVDDIPVSGLAWDDLNFIAAFVWLYCLAVFLVMVQQCPFLPPFEMINCDNRAKVFCFWVQPVTQKMPIKAPIKLGWHWFFNDPMDMKSPAKKQPKMSSTFFPLHEIVTMFIL